MAANWEIMQAWEGAPPYGFKAALADDGTVTVDDGSFGLWATEDGGEMTMALTNSAMGSITTYTGMGFDSTLRGTMIGWKPGSSLANGTWTGALILTGKT